MIITEVQKKRHAKEMIQYEKRMRAYEDRCKYLRKFGAKPLVCRPSKPKTEGIIT